MWFAAIISGAVALFAVIITIISSKSSGDFGLVSAGLGFGIWIALIAAAGITLFAWVFRNPLDDLKSGFESLKKTVSASTTYENKNTSVESNLIAELERLNKLKESGSISEAEFQQLKSKIL